MTLNLKIPEISKQIYREDVENVIFDHFNEFALDWWKHQLSWLNSVYLTFKDHDKFLISIYLLKKTFDNYSRNFIKFSMYDFFSVNKIEIEKFNVIEVSNYLKIPKETVRRKLVELEKNGAILRNKKKIILDRSVFPSIKPIHSIKRTSIFLSKFSGILKKRKIIDNEVSWNIFHKCINKNFTFCWKLYYELQLPIVIKWKNYFKDIETWHIFGLCVMNKSYYISKKKNQNHADFVNFILTESKENGLNAMTISEITGIPRATVVRKLKRLVKDKHLILDIKKRYHPSGDYFHDMKRLNKENMIQLSDFITKMFNQIII